MRQHAAPELDDDVHRYTTGLSQLMYYWSRQPFDRNLAGRDNRAGCFRNHKDAPPARCVSSV
jgi:hypothetical protein